MTKILNIKLGTTKTLNIKQGSEWTNDLGQTFPAAPLYRFEDENEEGGCWYSTLDKAEQSWNRWIASKPARELRRAESARLAAAAASHNEDDPFAAFDA